MKSLNKINDVFNVETDVDLPIPTSMPVAYNPSELDQEDDFQLARNTLRSLINKNDDVMTQNSKNDDVMTQNNNNGDVMIQNNKKW